MTRHPDEGTLHAFIDGELPQAEAAELELHVAACAQCASALAEARGLTAAASRVVNALDGAPTSASRSAVAAPALTAPGRAQRRSHFRAPYLRAAAVLLLAAGSAIVLDRSRSGSEQPRTAMTRETGSPTTTADAAGSRLAEPTSSAPAAVADGASGDEAGSRARTSQGRRTAERSAAPLANASAEQDAGAKTIVSQRDTRTIPEGEVAAASQPLVAPPTAAAPPRAIIPLAANRLEEVVVTGVTEGTRVIARYQLESGVILTLTEEPLARDSVRRRFTSSAEATPLAGKVAGASVQPAARTASMRLGSYRWISEERRRAYTLTGPLSDAEIEAAARRLGELKRLP